MTHTQTAFLAPFFSNTSWTCRHAAWKSAPVPDVVLVGCVGLVVERHEDRHLERGDALRLLDEGGVVAAVGHVGPGHEHTRGAVVRRVDRDVQDLALRDEGPLGVVRDRRVDVVEAVDHVERPPDLALDLLERRVGRLLAGHSPQDAARRHEDGRDGAAACRCRRRRGRRAAARAARHDREGRDEADDCGQSPTAGSSSTPHEFGPPSGSLVQARGEMPARLPTGSISLVVKRL